MNDGRSVEIAAKKPEDAIKQGLEQLGVTLDEVKVEVLETGGLFRKARVRLTLENSEPEKPEAKQTEAEHADSVEEKRAEEKIKSDVAPDVKREPEKKAAPAKPEEKKTDKKPTEKTAAAKPRKPKNSPKPEPVGKTANEKNVVAQAASDAEPAPQNESEKSDRKDNRASMKDDRSRDARKGDPSPDRKPRKLREEEKQALSRALEFVKGTLEKMGFDADVEADAEDPEKIYVTAPDGDDSLIIGRHGETLSALSYLAETAERAEKCKVNVTVDCNGYRARRAASLSSMARRRAKECVQRHRKIKLEPMDRIDRRTVHFALADNNKVTTASEGKEPYRCVVIFPKDDRRRDQAYTRDDEYSDVEEYEE